MLLIKIQRLISQKKLIKIMVRCCEDQIGSKNEGVLGCAEDRTLDN